MSFKATLHRLVSMYPMKKPSAGVTIETTEPVPSSQGVFVTPQSLVTFPVASLIVMAIWKVLSVVFPTWEASKVVPIVIAFIIGFFIYLISFSKQATTRAKFIGLGIAIINSFLLAASALGIDTAVLS